MPPSFEPWTKVANGSSYVPVDGIICHDGPISVYDTLLDNVILVVHSYAHPGH